MGDRTILHCDINNFYASVEALLNPVLKDKAIAVCGNPEKRHGIVLAKSMPAKIMGVKTGDTIWQAKKKCPDLIVVPPTFSEYVKYSNIVFNIYVRFTPHVESFGLDECWLDVTGCEKLFGSGEEIANKIRETVKAETGLTISVGVSFTKVFAKLGSDLKKPDAVTVISRENYKSVAWKLPVQEMIFVGHNTRYKLSKLGINTIGDLANCDKALLEKKFGKVGLKLHEWANGTDNDTVNLYTEKHIPKSVGNGTTTPADVTNLDDATSVIFALCEMIAFRLRQYGMSAKGVALHIKDKYFNSISRQCKVPATASAYGIATAAVNLLTENYDFKKDPPLRAITVSAFNLTEEGGYEQASFFGNELEKDKRLGESIDNIRKKYGYGVLRRGVNTGTIFTCDDREADDEFLPFNKHMKNLTDGIVDADE